MALTFDGIKYRTTQDVQDTFKTSAKTIKNLISSGTLPTPNNIQRGARTFRHFDDEWMDAAKIYFDNGNK